MPGAIYPIGGTIGSGLLDHGMLMIGTAAGVATPVAISSAGGLVSSAQGYTATASFTPAAAAYGAGDIMGATATVSFLDAASAALPTASMIRILTAVVKIDISSVPAGQTSFTLQCYNVTPPSAQADNDLWTLASVDLPSYLGSIALGTPVDLGAALYVKSQYIDFDTRLAGTNIFARLVTVGAHTAAAVARSITLHAIVM